MTDYKKDLDGITMGIKNSVDNCIYDLNDGIEKMFEGYIDSLLANIDTVCHQLTSLREDIIFDLDCGIVEVKDGFLVEVD